MTQTSKIQQIKKWKKNNLRDKMVLCATRFNYSSKMFMRLVIVKTRILDFSCVSFCLHLTQNRI